MNIAIPAATLSICVGDSIALYFRLIQVNPLKPGCCWKSKVMSFLRELFCCFISSLFWRGFLCFWFGLGFFSPESYKKKKKSQLGLSFSFFETIVQWVVGRLVHYFLGVHPELMQNVRAKWDLAGAEMLAFSLAYFIHQI